MLNVEMVRARFPSLGLKEGGLATYLDNPAGTQVPDQVIARIVDYLSTSNANSGGMFRTSRSTDAMVAAARFAMASFLNAGGPDEIVFGQSMTALTFQVAQALARTFQPGDEIVLTRQDHDGNVAPWLAIARERRLLVRWIDIDTHSYDLQLDALDSILGPRTKLVAIGLASNCTGTINRVKEVVDQAHAVGALVYVDAVQYLPHRMIDVRDLGCDLLVCSPYKFFGPHLAVLWGRPDLLATLPIDKVRPASNSAPDRFERGTTAFELVSGLLGVFDYLDWCADLVRTPAGLGRRDKWQAVFDQFREHEDLLCAQLLSGLQAIPGMRIIGHAAPDQLQWRVPTVSFVVADVPSEVIARAMADRNIFVWSGHNYAVELVGRLGLLESGGVVRIGIAHYNTHDEIAQCVQAVQQVLGERRGEMRV